MMLLQRLTGYAESTVAEKQAGFSVVRGTGDQLL